MSKENRRTTKLATVGR